MEESAQKYVHFASIFFSLHITIALQDDFKLGQLGVHCMCDLLVAHPYFNFSENIAQAVVPFLNHHYKPVREAVKTTCQTVFTEDKKGEITLKVRTS